MLAVEGEEVAGQISGGLLSLWMELCCPKLLRDWRPSGKRLRAEVLVGAGAADLLCVQVAWPWLLALRHLLA